MSYTVIIPTMWVKPICLGSMIRLYRKSVLINEIIIIDNNPAKRPIIQGVKIISKGENIFVNPAWNWGAKEAQEEKIIIANDDIYLKDFYLLLNHIDKFMKPGMVIGCGEKCYSEKKRSTINIKSITERNAGWGCMMFMYKESYKVIPDTLKIWFGDDILFENNESFAFDGVVIETEMSSTIHHHQLHGVIDEDMKVYRELYDKL